MKRKSIFRIIAFSLLICLVSCAFALQTSANETKSSETPSLEIVSNNVSYSDSLYILYAIANDGFDRTEHEIKMLFWDAPQESYALGTEKYSTTNEGSKKVKGKDCLIFYSAGLAAKEMTDDVFARACVVIDGKEYYSDVMKFSVLEYVHAMKEQGNIGQGQIKLFTTMLEYGTAAQNNFGHNTDKPANGNYKKIELVNGTFADGFNHGRFLPGQKILATADEPAEGMKFSYWVDENGIRVSYDKEFEIEVQDKAKQYTAVYRDVSSIATQLKLKSTILYDGGIAGIDLPSGVSIEINGETVTLEVVWNTSDFVAEKVGTQTLYAELVDTTAYEIYGIEPGSIVMEVTTLPYTLEIDQATGEYILTGYYGNDSVLTIPSTYNEVFITTITTRAFNNVASLTSVTVPTSIKKIEQGAFWYCDNIKSISLPFVGESATSSNSWLGWIFGAATYDVQHGMLPLALESVTIADGVTAIPRCAFYNCAQIKEFNISPDVTHLATSSFYGCTSLTEFTVPDGLSYISEPFNNCTNLKRINVSNIDIILNLDTGNADGNGNGSLFANGADLYCNGKLVTEINVPEGVTRLDSVVLGRCTSVKKITLPSTLQSLGMATFAGMTALDTVVFANECDITELSYTFTGCRNLTNVNTEVLDKLVSISGTFYGCASLTSITIPNSVTNIGSSSFYETAIEKITLPEGIQKIGSSTFRGCQNLKSITVPSGVVEIDDWAFYGCSSLESVNLPSSITTIGYYAFACCSSLTSITIPERVYNIETRAFESCTNLATIKILSSRLTTIGDGAFDSCKNLYEIYNLSELELTAGSSDYGSIALNAKVIHTTLDAESIITVDADGFIIYHDGTDNVLIAYIGQEKDIIIPNTVTVIGKNVFYNRNTITSVTIPDSVTKIGEKAFYSCSSLTSVTIPDSVTKIGENAFCSCYSLASIKIGSGVTEIGDRAFIGCSALTSIIIPDSVTKIGENAFYNCYRLVEVINNSELDIKAGNSNYGYVALYAREVHTGDSKITALGDYLFYTYGEVNYLIRYVGKDTVISLPESYNGKNYEIYNYAFYDCNALTSVTIPDSVTKIGSDAFYSCDSLASVTIGNGVTEIGDWAFENCRALTSIVIPDSVTKLGNYMFYGCSSLTSATVGKGITTLGTQVFYQCYSLTSVTFTDSVTKIGSSAFSGCNKLKDVYYTGTEEKFAAITIDSGNDPFINATVHFNYVPEE